MESKKKYLVGILSFAIVALVASGGIYAYFNDVESSNGNVITAGTLDLKLNGADDVTTAVCNLGPVYPGYTTNSTGSSSIVLTNVGNVNGVLSMSVTGLTGAPGAETEPELKNASTNDPTNGDLQEYLMVKITDGTNTVYEGLLSGFTTSWTCPLVATTGTVTLQLYIWIPAATGNDIQGDSVTFNLVFTLNQA